MCSYRCNAVPEETWMFLKMQYGEMNVPTDVHDQKRDTNTQFKIGLYLIIHIVHIVFDIYNYLHTYFQVNRISHAPDETLISLLICTGYYHNYVVIRTYSNNIYKFRITMA